jgi:mRNA-degrading endonuclease YafQ of YafQ-DinJ toxin-antitoxin module
MFRLIKSDHFSASVEETMDLPNALDFLHQHLRDLQAGRPLANEYHDHELHDPPLAGKGFRSCIVGRYPPEAGSTEFQLTYILIYKKNLRKNTLFLW